MHGTRVRCRGYTCGIAECQQERGLCRLLFRLFGDLTGNNLQGALECRIARWRRGAELDLRFVHFDFGHQPLLVDVLAVRGLVAVGAWEQAAAVRKFPEPLPCRPAERALANELRPLVRVEGGGEHFSGT